MCYIQINLFQADVQAEEKYKNQLDQMQLMGFHNRQANLQGKITDVFF